jgi:hypothetical protein
MTWTKGFILLAVLILVRLPPPVHPFGAFLFLIALLVVSVLFLAAFFPELLR